MTRRRATLLVICCLAALPALATSGVHGAEEQVIVGANVEGWTSINLDVCDPAAGVTDFGQVLPAATTVTSEDCAVEFGSSDGLAQLTISQADGLGLPMWQPTRGELDPGFGSDGKVSVSIAPGTGQDRAFATVVQPDGKVIAAGYCQMGGATGWDICLARLNPDGTLDTTFAGDGTLTIPIAPGSGQDLARAVALQPDGRILVAGYCDMGGATGRDFCVARVTADGTLDATFAGDGRLTIAMAPGSNEDRAWALGIQPDGRILVVGRCQMGVATGWDFCLARLHPNGTLDTSFAGDGTLTFPIAPGSGEDFALGVVVQPDGRIVLAGECNMGGASTGYDICIVRLEADGSFDTTFAGDGRLLYDISPGNGWDAALDVALQPDGKIVTAGWCRRGGAGGDAFCMSRVNPDGTLDSTFAGDGKLAFDIAPGAGADWGWSVEIQPDGRMLVAGRCDMGGSTGPDFCLARVNPDGTLDTTFGTDGAVTVDIAPGTGEDYAWGVGLLPDGGAVATGWCDMGGTTGIDFCLVAFDNAGEIQQYVPGTSDWDTAGTSHFAACLRTISDATSIWTPNATCPASNGTWWNPIPESPVLVAQTTVAGTDTAVANLRFGLRTSPTQEPGRYVAPLTFTAVAP